ncbi:hypothetical protein C5Q96_05940 [Mogibacterium diversum]|uniref:MucBP domain-containing protein n=1 Tax=Mogibacterium diversum TaxID=114527 RepID=A0A2S0L548_9FIRM|nr:MucBP domain-containing protein [Mogibacterium diversum]AVM48409.1 hypothetical protein C5Q96_05940 [Mogibacterium diversum]
MIKKISSIVILFCIILFNIKPIVMAADYAELGDSSAASGSLSEETEQTADNTPSISGVNISGDFNEGTRGPDYFKNIKIDLIGENLTDDNFLTEEGLRWTDKTEVELISGTEVGHLNSSSNFGSERPSVPVKMFSTDNGSSGRITYVGKTKSGIDLDLIWEIEDSDKDDWEANSGLNRHGSIRGIGFSGEQFFPNAIGNSISVLYNNANNISINYKIVKHGTMDENQVVLSFISSDIDTAQGVSTDLANLAELIPSASNLVKDNDIIYDVTPGTVGLNGSKDLPRGGYLGAGFLSAFNYTFYSPAPPRYGNSFNYSMAVRYALFGSSLQAKLETKVNQHIRVEYIDEQGTPIKQAANLKGITGYSYRIDKADILNYSLIGVQKDISNINKPIIRFVYRKNPVQESTANKAAPQNRARRTRRSIQSNTVKTNRTYKGVTSSSAKSYAKPKSSKKDPFLVNTGMTAEEKRVFIQYLKEVEKNARKKYGNNRDKINHEVANAIIYPSYDEDLLQNQANSLKKPHIGRNTYLKGRDLLADTNKQNIYKIDFPHMASPLGSYERSSILKELTKGLATLPITVYEIKELTIARARRPLVSYEKSKIIKKFKKVLAAGPYAVTGKDKFFYLNSYTGDYWTHLDEKDLRSDKDAFILKYHPKYKGKLYSKSIIDYYSQDNLDEKRDKFFKEILEKQAGPGVTADEQLFLNNFSATLSIGGFGLLIYFVYIKKDKEAIKKINAAKKNKRKILKKAIKIYKKKISHSFIGERIKNIKARATRVIRSVKKGIRNSVKVIKKLTNVAKNKCIKILRTAKKYIAKQKKKIVSKLTNKLKKLFKRK